MLFARKPPTCAHEWIAIATRGLCDDARERISTEIRQHIAVAVNDFRGRGAHDTDTLPQAERDAVASLGSPRRARQQFKKTHLTKNEAGVLVCLTGKNLFPWWFMLVYILLLGMPCLILLALMITIKKDALAFPSLVAGGAAFLALGLALRIYLRKTHPETHRVDVHKSHRLFYPLIDGVVGTLLIVILIVDVTPLSAGLAFLVLVDTIASFCMTVAYFRACRKTGRSALVAEDNGPDRPNAA